ncbi:uncharacterized protein LOC135708506 [Ochlerotatus camptorhynchus]|uniref:uncharacterized protein LOC135708506 n=1 Tax=Ochlerotatus camptorhynchus TaxID=644619 RepID=UPI0031E0DD11
MDDETYVKAVYKQPPGQEFYTAKGRGKIDVDFRLMYGIDDGVKKWNLAFPKLVKYLDRPYKDDFSKNILECLTSPESDLDVKTCAVLLLLNNVLKPTKVTRKFKPSILAAQEEIILFAASNDLATGVFTKFNEDYSKYGFQPVPKLIFIGEGIGSLEGEFQVRFQDFSYRFDSASRAIDVLVKFCGVFGLEHSRISRLVWLFISAFFYNVPVQEQYECINSLKAYLLN